MSHPLRSQVCHLDWKLLYKHLEETGQLNNPRIVNEMLYLRGYRDFEFFVSYFFAHHCPLAFSSMHTDFCELEKDPEVRGRRDVVAAPRGNAKTTFKVLFKILHAIVYEYEPFILIVGHSASEAEQKVRDVLDELEHNERLIQVYGALAPVQGVKSQGKARWGKKWFVTQNDIQVKARSRGQQVRGLKHGPNRPSLIVCDDIESPDGVLSPEQRQKTRDWFFKDIMKCGQTGGVSNVTVIGTCLHPESLLCELLVSPGWQSKRYQAIQRYASRQDLWEQHRAIYIDLSNPQRQAEAEAFFKDHEAQMLEGTEVLWPAGEPYETLMRQRIDEGQASFNSEKQNDPHDPERQLFRMETAQKCRVEFEGGHFRRIHWLDGSGKVVERDQLQRLIAFHDPALGKKANQHSNPDYAAIIVAAVDYDNYFYCLDAYIEKDPPSRQIEQALIFYQRWRFETLYLEENHFQALLKPLYDKAAVGPHPIRVQGVTQHENKHKRISTLEPDIYNGHLLFADSLTPRLEQQLTLFPTTYDDGPDALQGAIAQLKKSSLADLWKAAI